MDIVKVLTLTSQTIQSIDTAVDVAIPHIVIMHKNMRLCGKWMFERSDIADLVKLIENGMLDIGVAEVVGSYPLEQWKEASDKAAEKAGFGQVVFMKP